MEHKPITNKKEFMYQFISLSLALVAFALAGCVNEKSTKAPSKEVSKNTKSQTTTSSNVLSAIGSNTGKDSPQHAAETDRIIEFSSSASGLRVCKFPSGVCRTNADEGSGGASAYGDIPNSQNSFLHYMKFRFYSNGYFAKNPNGHIAFGLRGKRMRVEEYGDKAGVDGRGMIIGAIGYGYFYNKNNRACVERMAQIESFYRSAHVAKNAEYGNKIFPETCSDTIFEDNTWYTVELEVTSHKYIIYKVFNNSGKLIYKSYIYDQPNYLDPNLTTWFIGHVFETANATWSVRLENFEVGHIVNGDVFYPVKDFSSPLSFSINNVPVSPEKARDYSIIVNKGARTQIKLNHVYNRTRLFGCASFRKTKTGVDNVDCQKPENYRIMTFTTESDWSYSGETYSLKDTFVNNYPTQFYTIYFRLNPQDYLTETSLSFELRDNTPAQNSGTFCDTNSKTITNWVCGSRPQGASWVDVGSGCFHQATQTRCN